MKKLGLTSGIVAIAVALCLSGCMTERSAHFEVPGAVLVGGGKNIEFIAPSAGVIYLTDQGELVLTKSLDTNEKFVALGTVPIGTHESWALTSEARLYFQPWKAPKNNGD